MGRQKGWQTESTLFNATVPTLNKRPHLVAHPGPPPMYNNGSYWHPITPTPAAPHSALGVPPYAQVAQHLPMAPHVTPAPSRSSVSGGHQNPTRRPPSHARFQPYTRTPHQSSRKRPSSQLYSDSLQRDWGYTSIYPERADDWASQHPAPWGPPTTGTHVQCGGRAYRAPESDDYSGLRLTMSDATDFRAHTKLQVRSALRTATYERQGVHEDPAQMPNRQDVWDPNIVFRRGSRPEPHSTFSSGRRHPDGHLQRAIEAQQLFQPDTPRHAAGNPGADATPPMSLDYGSGRLAPLPDSTSYRPEGVRRGRAESRQRVRGCPIGSTILLEDQNHANDDHGRSFAAS